MLYMNMPMTTNTTTIRITITTTAICKLSHTIFISPRNDQTCNADLKIPTVNTHSKSRGAKKYWLQSHKYICEVEAQSAPGKRDKYN
jgi:hypothetical protein